MLIKKGEFWQKHQISSLYKLNKNANKKNRNQLKKKKYNGNLNEVESNRNCWLLEEIPNAENKDICGLEQLLLF